MKTTLFGKSNAILVEVGGFEPIAIIACKGGQNIDISKKLKLAITEHYSLAKGTNIKLTPIGGGVLKNQQSERFEAEFEDDGEPCVREFGIFITITY